MKYTIDEIMDMLASNDEQTQKQGIEAASEVKTLKCFMRPPYGSPKDCTWENCAIVVSQRTDKELSLYMNMTDLFIWISDETTPGYSVIFERLLKFKDKELLKSYISYLIKTDLRMQIPYAFSEIIDYIGLTI